jgi:hypothetical protein
VRVVLWWKLKSPVEPDQANNTTATNGEQSESSK